MTDCDIHEFQSEEFPKMKAPMDTTTHPDDHMPDKFSQSLGTAPQASGPTNTGAGPTRHKAMYPNSGKDER